MRRARSDVNVKLVQSNRNSGGDDEDDGLINGCSWCRVCSTIVTAFESTLGFAMYRGVMASGSLFVEGGDENWNPIVAHAPKTVTNAVNNEKYIATTR